MSRQVNVFIVYARNDSDLKERLLKHLAPLLLQGLISTWHDVDIDGGDEWESKIQANMAASELILLLVSPDFMGSSYIQSEELIEALRRHDEGTAVVVPIFLRPAFWEIANFAKLQGFPRNGQSVESSSARTTDEALLEVTKGISVVIRGIGEPPPPPPVADNLDNDHTSNITTPVASEVATVVFGRQTDLTIVVDETEHEFDDKYRDGQPFLRLVAYPGILSSDVVDIESDAIESLLLTPPGQRRGGWNVALGAGSLDHWRDGVQAEGRFARLRLSISGLMEFTQNLERAFRWREKEDGFSSGPRLYPYPVIEYPLSFVTLYKNLLELARPKGPFTFEMQYWDLKGWHLPPYLPGQTGFIFANQPCPYPEQHFRTVAEIEARDYDPGEVTGTLLRPFYRSFGHGSEAIPTYDKDSKRVTFDLASR